MSVTMDNDYQECNFETYCKTCKYKDIKEVEDPCNECLDEPMNLYTDKPVKYKEKE